MNDTKRTSASWAGAACLVVGVTLGVLVGLNVQSFAPHVPIHATATHGRDNFAIATGPVDESVEALYVLDFLTGELKAAVLNNQIGQFSGFFTYNIAADFGTAATKNPQYLMVTGLTEIRRRFARQNVQTRSVVYIAEATSGQVAAYAIPWNPSFQSARKPQAGSFIPLDKRNFRTTVIRE